jgi:class 3 adenylate cyclase
MRNSTTSSAAALWYNDTLSQKTATFLDGRYMLIASVLITIYALIGDDLRLCATQAHADDWFNVATLFCAAFFTTEILLSVMAKPDYFMGFFFWLDVMATGSLVLDLTWVSDLLAEESLAEEGADRARGGRTARLGASLGRVIRVLRLVRIVKLYKAFFEKHHKNVKTSKARGTSVEIGRNGRRRSSTKLHRPDGSNISKKSSDDSGNIAPGWDSDDTEGDEDTDNDQPGDAPRQESLVGKMLVSLTTRRVIMLVLVMLLVLPNMSVEGSSIIPMSAWWGADGIFTAFNTLQVNGSASNRADYEEKLLRYMYYHNWFTGNWGCESSARACPDEFFAHAFWVGFAGRNATELSQSLSLAQLTRSQVDAFDAQVRTSSDLYDMGGMPTQARDALSQPWGEDCEYARLQHRGVSLLAQEISGDGGVGHTVRCPSDLRPQEKLRVYPLAEMAVEDALHVVFFFDMRRYVQEEAVFSMLTTGFVCFALCAGSLIFAKDANELVLRPVEKMIDKVNAIRDDPLKAIKMADAEFEKEERRETARRGGIVIRRRRSFMAELAHQYWDWGPARGLLWLQSLPDRILGRRPAKRKKASPKAAKHTREALMETAILEKTIIKLGSLLALGFGEAGATIIGHNLRGQDTAGINTMVPGERVDCIIGHARVRHFKYCTEVLQAKIMTFVNHIAEIVHGLVNECHGAPNKNNGDTFLIIWRAKKVVEGNCLVSRRVADLSILAFARIIGAVQRSPVLARYREHPGLQQRLRSDCQVRLCFGLHFGWAIEGAVGSDYKIDASYLSPNVQIAEAMSMAAKMYDVSFVSSHEVLKVCSEGIASKLRLIDKVLIHGSKAPLNLHCLDVQNGAMKRVTKVEKIAGQIRTPLVWNVRERFRARQLIEVEKARLLAFDTNIVRIFDEDEDISVMRNAFTEEFKQVFNMGYQNYVEGEWQVARRMLTHTHKMLGFRDGPSGALLSFMEAPYEFQAPSSWRGVRTLSL